MKYVLIFMSGLVAIVAIGALIGLYAGLTLDLIFTGLASGIWIIYNSNKWL